MIKKNYNRK